MREITGGNLTAQSVLAQASKVPLQAFVALECKLIVAFGFVFIFALELLSYNFFKRELVRSDKKACNSFFFSNFLPTSFKAPTTTNFASAFLLSSKNRMATL